MPPRPYSASVEYMIRPLDADRSRAIKTWEARADRAGEDVAISFKSAVCPVCEDDSLPPAWSVPQIMTASFGLSTSEHKTEQIVVRCACRKPHVGRPLAEPFGCGAVWTIRFTWSWDELPGPVILEPGPVPSPADLSFAARLDELRKVELERARSQAAGWSKIMASLAGLLGASQLFGSRRYAAELAEPWPSVIGILLLSGLLLAAASSVLAGVAAYGKPTTTKFENTAAAGGQAAALQLAVDEQVAKIRPALLRSAITAALAFAAAGLAAAAMWWAPMAT